MAEFEEDEDDLEDDEDPDPSDQDSSDEDGDICAHCGKYIFEDAAVCPHCLMPVNESVHHWRHGKSWFIFGLICVLLILVTTFLVFGRAMMFGW